MRVAHISHCDGRSGSGIAARRINEALNENLDIKKSFLQKTKRPPLVHIVESVEEKELFIEKFYQSRKNGKSSSSLYELLLGQTWSQINDPESKTLISDMGKWRKRLQDLEKENSGYDFLNKHL